MSVSLSARRTILVLVARLSLGAVCVAGALGGMPGTWWSAREARANPPHVGPRHGGAHSGYHQVHMLAAAQRVAQSAERLEHALGACRANRQDVQLAEQVERRADALHEALRCHAPLHRVQADFAALGASYRALDAHMHRHYRHAHHDPHVSRAWLALRGDYERLAGAW